VLHHLRALRSNAVTSSRRRRRRGDLTPTMHEIGSIRSSRSDGRHAMQQSYRTRTRTTTADSVSSSSSPSSASRPFTRTV
jgi:hypothetical protein